MFVQKITQILLWSSLGILLAFIGVVVWFFIDHQSFEHRVYRNVIVLGQPVGTLNAEELQIFLEDLNTTLGNQRISIEYEQGIEERHSHDLGFELDIDTISQELLELGQEGGITQQFVWWMNRWRYDFYGDPLQVINDVVLNAELNYWEHTIGVVPPDNGSAQITDSGLTIELPHHGSRLDREAFREQIIFVLTSLEAAPYIQLPLQEITSQRSVADLQELQSHYDSLIQRDILLTHPRYDEFRIVLTPEDLLQLVRLREESDLSYRLYFDEVVLIPLLEPLRPKEASFDFSDPSNIQINESHFGFYLDYEATEQAIINTGVRNETGERIAYFVPHSIVRPEFATEEARVLGLQHRVSSFTTYHSCCGNRVHNIHLVADLVDGHIVYPGESFNLNTFLGERTVERGFKEAGTIIKGELTDTVGGGISQFATTFHNAVYWGGYRIIEHKPHSIYFSRYPEGVEATINWPYVNYIFENDTEHALYIDTEYTDTSITVNLYSDNAGRDVVGDHAHGRTNLNVTGSTPESRRVISHVSERYNVRDPFVEYTFDESVPRGTEIIEQEGSQNWTVIVSRTVKQGEEIIEETKWPVYYRGEDRIIRLHPCERYPERSDCIQEETIIDRD